MVIAVGMVLGVAISMATPAWACGQHQPCTADAIDGFFMPLITGSLGKPGRGTAFPPIPVPAPAPSPLPPSGGAIIIKPPPAPETGINNNQSLPPGISGPVQHLQIGQTLVGGRFSDGGTAEMFAELLAPADMPPDGMKSPAVLSDLVLAPYGASHDVLTMEALVSLPIGEAWPLQSLSQQVQMQVSCGACGPAGRISHLVGTGKLHIQTAPWGYGHITDIRLQSPDGPTAHGEMHFILRTSDKSVFTDTDARLHLVIDSLTTDLVTQLVAWRGQRREMTGLFVGMPIATTQDFGSFAGQFSGAGCDAVCGVEN